MLALALISLLHTAPRTDGVWFPAKVAAKALKSNATEIELLTGVTFGPAEVTIGYGHEEETRSWREGTNGLEVRSGDDWRPIQWAEGKKGTVKTDIKQAGAPEELIFVARTLEQLRKERTGKLTAALLATVNGKWTAPGYTFELQADSRLNGLPVVIRPSPCNLGCEGKQALCVSVGDAAAAKLYLPSNKKLIEVAIDGLCAGGEGAGVARVEGGLVFERR